MKQLSAQIVNNIQKFLNSLPLEYQQPLMATCGVRIKKKEKN